MGDLVQEWHLFIEGKDPAEWYTVFVEAAWTTYSQLWIIEPMNGAASKTIWDHTLNVAKGLELTTDQVNGLETMVTIQLTCTVSTRSL